MFILQNLLLLIGFVVISIATATSDQDQCDAKLVETIPDGVTFEQHLGIKTIHSAFLDMIHGSKKSIQIASFYWTLFCNDTQHSIPTSCKKGEEVMQALNDALNAGVSVQIAFSGKTEDVDKNQDLQILRQNGAQIVGVDFPRLIGAGILHTKFIITDNQTVFIGSANMDWRSLSEVKEMGIYIQNCPQIATDLEKIFQVYWILGQSGSEIPTKWPDYLSTTYNMANPMKINLSGIQTKLYISNSPPELNPSGRTNDIDALTKVISSAESFVDIEVMDYSPMFLYSNISYWPKIDDILRSTVFKKYIDINFLGGHWRYSRKNMIIALRSLNKLRKIKGGGSIEVKLMKIPATEAQAKVEFSRVNHCKFIVTDNTLFIGTSNWSPDYFVTTGGVSFIMTLDSSRSNKNGDVDLRTLLQQAHERDWHSQYSTAIRDD
ncbi:5'-3' exonuclease PLD3-like [Brevipalpus obovatus]|uniref:5'-3' exonuclease PLD3-like n=1 Tax=Brevipalpus obovatus TaxID=246614 RepID=UPI003D9E76DF